MTIGVDVPAPVPLPATMTLTIVLMAGLLHSKGRFTMGIGERL